MSGESERDHPFCVERFSCGARERVTRATLDSEIEKEEDHIINN